jgi:CSLREA domain-containing protein
LANLLVASLLVATLPFERFFPLPFVQTAHAAGLVVLSAPDLQETSDTGTNNDNITSDNSPTFDITGAEPGATVELLRDGTSLSPAVTGIADINGNVTLTDPGPASDGDHSYTVTQTNAGDISVPSTALVVTIDTAAPTVTIDRAAGQADTTSTSPINFAVIFSEAVTGFDSSDIQVGGTAGATTAVVTGSGTTYNVAVSGMTTTGTVIISFAAGAATDAAGNGNAAPTVTDDSVDFVDPGAFTAFVVTTTADTNDGTCDDDCSLREAITAANADSGAETITFAAELTGVIILQTELPALTGGTTITGPGANMMTVLRDSDALTQFRIFTLTTSDAVNISGLTISGGSVAAPGGGGIFNNGAQLQLTNVVVSGNTATTSSGMGGGILTAGGSLTLTNSTVTGNNSGCDGGGIDVFNGTLIVENSTISNNNSSLSGGGIFSFGSTTTVTGSTLSGNTAVTEGGGIYNAGTLELTNSTVSGNSSQVSGGGIYNHDISSATLTSVTITNNHADSNDDASGDGGGIYNSNVSPLLRNTIVARNFKGSGTPTPATANDIQGMAVDSNSSFNLIGTGGAGGLASGAPNNNLVGVSDPGLGSLQNNGGPTQTHALLTGSPAIDAGDGFGLITDQRGFNRPVDIPGVNNVADGSDIGSFETGNHAPINSVPGAQVTDEDTPLVFSFDSGNRISISDIDAGSSPVQVTLTATNGTINLANIEDIIFSVGDGFDDTTMTFTGAINDINAALNGLTFTPTPNYNGAASLQIATNDQGNTGAGGPQSDTDTINITVNAVNDAPITNNDAYSVNENGTLNVPAPGVLANDSDIENSPLAAVLVSSTSSGTLALNANGSFTYTPQAGFSGIDSFTYRANDGSLNGNIATVTITVNDGGTLAFDSATYNVNENGGSATITITRTGSSAGTATVLFSTSNGTASTSDYTPVSTTVTFNNGEISKTVNILISDDTLNETNETVNLTLSNAGGTGQLGSPSSATLTIVDNDSQPSLSINDVTVTEGNSGTVDATFTVTLSAASGQTVTVNYQTANGTATIADGDYLGIPSTTLTFNPGETTKTVTVKVNGDLFFETDEDFFVNLSGQTNSTIADASGRGVITNDDASPTLTINDVIVTEGNAGTINATFTVTLTSQSGQSVTVNYQTANGTAISPSDYQSLASTLLTFLPGETTKSITVQVNGDTTNEVDETFFVNLSGATNATISDNQGLGTILNDDATTVSLSASSYNITEDGLRATIVVNRQGDLSQALRIDYLTSDPSGLNNCDQVTGNASSRCDYATTAGTLRFAAGETSKTIFIPIINDVYLDGPEVFTLTLSNPVGGQLGSFSTATITITDNDTAPAPNPINNDEFFIRELYIDILGREPEPSGLAAWLTILNHCAVPTDCDRIAVARGFVRSLEFQDRGYFVYRAFRASLGRFARYQEFMIDRAKVSGFLSAQDLEANKVAYIEEFMNRQEFKSLYDPTIGNPTAFVDTLLQKADLPNHPRRAEWIAGLTNNTLTRVQVLRQLIESAELYGKYVNEAFIVMNYFGFLRRDPDAAYLVWINTFNQTMDDRVIINGFINSLEYRLRFGPN